jgi:hypothetical protein
MKRTLLALLVLVPLAGCAHEQAGYAGGPVSFDGDCLDAYGYGCDYGPYHRYHSYYGYAIAGEPALQQRVKVSKVERKTSTRVVERRGTSSSPRGASPARAVPARSAPAASRSQSAPAAHASHASSHR